jgi:hypothetical protein
MEFNSPLKGEWMKTETVTYVRIERKENGYLLNLEKTVNRFIEDEKEFVLEKMDAPRLGQIISDFVDGGT